MCDIHMCACIWMFSNSHENIKFVEITTIEQEGNMIILPLQNINETLSAADIAQRVRWLDYSWLPWSGVRTLITNSSNQEMRCVQPPKITLPTSHGLMGETEKEAASSTNAPFDTPSTQRWEWQKRQIRCHGSKTRLIIDALITNAANTTSGCLKGRKIVVNLNLLILHYKYLLSTTVGPRLSGHQLSGYLYYPAMILQYIVYCLFSTTVLLKTKTK